MSWWNIWILFQTITVLNRTLNNFDKPQPRTYPYLTLSSTNDIFYKTEVIWKLRDPERGRKGLTLIHGRACVVNLVSRTLLSLTLARGRACVVNLVSRTLISLTLARGRACVVNLVSRTLISLTLTHGRACVEHLVCHTLEHDTSINLKTSVTRYRDNIFILDATGAYITIFNARRQTL